MSSPTAGLPTRTRPFPASDRETVQMPPFFVHFMAKSPRVNPHYEAVRAKGEKKIAKFCNFDERMIKAIDRCDFSYFIGVFAPDAPLDKFLTLIDYGNWAFPFDDPFDNGELRDQPGAAAKVVDCLLSALHRGTGVPYTEEEKPVLVRWHDKIWERLVQGSSKGTQDRYAAYMQDYCEGALLHVQHHADSYHPSLEGMIAARTKSIGVTPVFALVEYANGLQLVDKFVNDEKIQELEKLTSDFVIIHNDVLPYVKEEAEGVPHNIVAACRLAGMTAQEAFDHVGSMLESRYQRWEKAMKDLNRYDGDVAAELEKYLEGLENIVRANLHWSFRSGRYFGSSGEEVKKTGKIDVLKSPAYLVLEKKKPALL